MILLARGAVQKPNMKSMIARLYQWIVGFFKSGILRKLMLFFVIIIVLPVFASGYYIYRQSDSYIYERFTRLCEDIADQSVANLDKKFNEYEYLMRIVQSDTIIKNLLEPGYYSDYEKVDEINRYTSSVFSDITSINRSIRKIRIFFTLEQLQEVAGYFYDYSRISGDEWYARCLKELGFDGIGWSPSVHSVAYDIDTSAGVSNDVISGVMKIFDRQYDEVVGLLEFQIDKGELTDTLLDIQPGDVKPGLAIYFSGTIDTYGEFPTEWAGIQTNDNSITNSVTLKNPAVNSMDEYVRQLKSKWGRQYYFTTKKLDRLGCTVIYSFPLQNIKSQGFANRRFIFAVLFTSAAILILISWILVRLVFSKFKKLLFAVKRIQKGDLDTKIDIHNQDEVGELACNINIMTDRIKELMNTNVAVKTAQKEAQIKALQAQINPHFMYNTLEAIKMMAEVRDELAISDAISSLGRILRYTVSPDARDFVSLFDEISYIRNYISILNLLYDRIDFSICIEPGLESELREAGCIRLIIQPFVENSVKHGLKGLLKGGLVKIDAGVEGNNIRIVVSDNGRGFLPERLAAIRGRLAGDGQYKRQMPEIGLGIMNVHERLELIYGAGYGVSIESEEMVMTKVTVTFPKIPVIKEDHGGIVYV
jgi:two-component system, sensor histidine kinase YesM